MMNQSQKFVILSLLTSLFAVFFFYLAIFLGVFLASVMLYAFASFLLALNIYSIYVNYRTKKIGILILLIVINLFLFVVFTALTFSAI